MRTSLLTLGIYAIFSATAAAQDFESTDPPAQRLDVKKVRFGIYFAPNVSWMKATSARSDDGTFRITSGGSKVGYTWGVMADYFFAENYGIATGFQLNTSGGMLESTRTSSDSSFRSTVYNANMNYSLQYLEVPFQLKLRSDAIDAAGNMRVFGQIGVTGGFNIGKKATYRVDYTDQYGTFQHVSGDKEKLSGSFAIAPVLLQLNIGAGVEKPVGEKMALYFGLFFNNSFLPDVTNPAKYDMGYSGSFSDGNIRMNSFAFRFGLFF